MQASGILGAKPLISAHRLRVGSVYTPGIDTSMAATSSTPTPTPKWTQKTITLSPQRRGCYFVTSKVLKEIGQELSDFKCGLAHLFLQHTSASLTINENYDADVREDTETFLKQGGSRGKFCSLEAYNRSLVLRMDRMICQHISTSSMFGCALTIPITNGKLNMGTWQGIWLCEHRDYPTARKVVVRLNGI